MSKQVLVDSSPNCDICGKEAHYDARTKQGAWANLCDKCFKTYTNQKLGLGFGQKLILKGETNAKVN